MAVERNRPAAEDRSEREAAMATETIETFAPTHHALMMAWISKAVVDAVGEEEGERVVRRAVARYGNQRGRRMAMRAEANGHSLSMANCLAYAELKLKKSDMSIKIVERSPHARGRVSACPWTAAWEESDLMGYGRFYCLEIDKAVLHGFNEDLVLEVHSIMPDGAKHCDMTYMDANFTLPRLAGLAWRKTVNPGRRAVMPWEYHVGHLYKTLGEVITEELGEEAIDVMAAALDEFTDRYGEAAAETVLAYQGTDFDRLP